MPKSSEAQSWQTLPNLALERVFKSLQGFEDANILLCRLVCKQWKVEVDRCIRSLRVASPIQYDTFEGEDDEIHTVSFSRSFERPSKHRLKLTNFLENCNFLLEALSLVGRDDIDKCVEAVQKAKYINTLRFLDVSFTEISTEQLALLHERLPKVTIASFGCWKAILPGPSLCPIEVVMLQLEALRNNKRQKREAGIRACYQFASPANKQYTGPEDRFVFLISNFFDKLCDPDISNYQIKRAVVQEDHVNFKVSMGNRKVSDVNYLWAVSLVKPDNDSDFLWWMTAGVS